MFTTVHTQHSAHDRRVTPLRSLSAPSVTLKPASSCGNGRAWLRAAKQRLRESFGYRSAGGTKLSVIASALGVNDAKASRILSADYPDWISDDVHLARLEAFGFAAVADAVRAVSFAGGAADREAA